MASIAAGSTKTAVVGSIEHNLFDFFSLFSSCGEFIDTPRIKWVYNDSVAINRIFGANFKEHDADYQINRLKQRFDAFGAPVVWIVGPSTRPAGIGLNLELNDFEYVCDWKGMSFDLESAQIPEQNIDDFWVCPASPEQIGEWTDITVRSYDFSGEFAKSFSKVMSKLFAGESKKLRFLLGFKNGRAVCSGIYFVGSGVVGLYWIATLPCSRRQGLASEFVARMLDFARRDGAKRVVLHASPMGQGMYTRLGFEEHCTFQIYSHSI